MKVNQKIILLAIMLIPATFLIILSSGDHKMNRPPVLGVKTLESNGDTLYHTIPSFSFTSHNGETITKQDIEGKVVVVDFFFATCKSICPKMSTEMTVVQQRSLKFDDVVILSHTVDPEHDSVSVLKAYADEYNAVDGKWYFLTGNKKELYRLARKGYLIPAGEGDGGEEDFIHSEQFVLIDKQQRIRGFYDGTNSTEVKDMIDDIKALRAEEFIPFKNKL